MRYNMALPNADFNQNKTELAEIPVQVKSYFPRGSIVKESTQKFYLRYYLTIFVVFSNSLLSFGLNESSIHQLIISVAFILFFIIFSLFSITSTEKENFPGLKKIFNPYSLLILTGLGLVIIDPSILGYFLSQPMTSYLSSLQTLILLSALGYRYSYDSIKFTLFVVAFAIISLILSLYIREDTEKVIFEFLVLICFILLGALYIKLSHPLRHAKTTPVGPVASGVEEITNNIEKIIDRIIDINENPEHKNHLPEIIQQLKSVNLMLRKTSNIYSAQMNSVLEGMDEQDKIFIGQACFDSYNASNCISPKADLYSPANSENIYGESELGGVLKMIGKEWNFNTFFIDTCTKGKSIQTIGSYTIKKFGLDSVFEVTEETLKNFLNELERRYIKNPYHNSAHAADVMCSLIFLIQSSMLFEHVTSLELFAAIIAALGHDTGHPGKNNRFIVMSRNDIAILYNDISVLEMMHASIVFQIMKEVGNNILEGCVGEKWSIVRKDIIDMILATDMGKHFELMGQFKTKYLNTELHDFSSGETRGDLFKLIIKAADIGHAAKNIELHEKWCSLVIQEFFTQGDLEKSLGIPVSMYCDKETTDISKSQSGFIKNIVHPLFSNLNSVLSSYQIDVKCVQQLIINQKYWENYKKSGRGNSLIISRDSSIKKESIFPKIKSRKGSLPEVPLV